MPELPEVETVRRTLEKLILNEPILDISYDYEPMIKMNAKDFVKKVKGQTIHSIERYGKYLVFILDDDAMIMHMRMEGKFYIKSFDQEKSVYEHVIFRLSDKELRYHDTRKFGTIHLVSLNSYKSTYPLKDLGSEPKDLDPLVLYQKIHHRTTPIKVSLLDQHIISGLGNIYVDETLFLSKINPQRPSNKITKQEAKSLVESATKVLDKAVLLGGSTIRSYTSSLGVHGRFQNELNVHTKVGEPCPICGQTIIKTKVGGRGTYVCPSCQK